MDIDSKVNLLICSDNNQAYQALKVLLKISEQCNAVYSHFDTFIDMMNHPNNAYIRMRGLRLIAYNSKWDIDNKVNACIVEWLRHTGDKKPIVARQCIQDCVIIAKYKPELIAVICEVLEGYTHIYSDSMQPLIYKDRQKAIRLIRQYTW